MGKFAIQHEVSITRDEGYTLCFQFGHYTYQKNQEEDGYRFIWRNPNGTLKASRGQARLPSLMEIQYLTGKALSEGWGGHDTGSFAYK